MWSGVTRDARILTASVTALNVMSWPGVFQMIQKYIMGWKVGLEAERGFLASEP